jgi:hypothetical protein
MMFGGTVTCPVPVTESVSDGGGAVAGLQAPRSSPAAAKTGKMDLTFILPSLAGLAACRT